VNNLLKNKDQYLPVTKSKKSHYIEASEKTKKKFQKEPRVDSREKKREKEREKEKKKVNK